MLLPPGPVFLINLSPDNLYLRTLIDCASEKLILGHDHKNRAREQYSVMQLDWNSFGGEVVLDKFHKVSRNEDNILD